jgi:hypothetical protein
MEIQGKIKITLCEIENEVESVDNLIKPIFSAGLVHILSGIVAQIPSSVVSATMTWYLVIEESRFHVYHDIS